MGAAPPARRAGEGSIEVGPAVDMGVASDAEPLRL
jgi:hypothetical protein